VAIRLISLTPVEHEAFIVQPEIKVTVDTVGKMIDDLHEEEVNCDILLVINDADRPAEFQLNFGGSTMSMDFYEDRIEINDFDPDTTEESLLMTFQRNEVNMATQWLVNQTRE
jgi:hypothetical protein